MTDDINAISGEDGGYVPCDEVASPEADSVQDSVAIAGDDEGFVPIDTAAAADDADLTDTNAVFGRGAAFVAKPCEPPFEPGTFLDLFNRSSWIHWNSLFGGPAFNDPPLGPIATDSGHFWGDEGKSVGESYGYLSGGGPEQESGSLAFTTDVLGFTNATFRLEVDFEVFPYDHAIGQHDVDNGVTDSFGWYETAPDDTFLFNVEVFSASGTHKIGFRVANTLIRVYAETSTSTDLAAAFGAGSYNAVFTADQATGVVTLDVGGLSLSHAFAGSFALTTVPRNLFVQKGGYGSAIAVDRIQSFNL